MPTNFKGSQLQQNALNLYITLMRASLSVASRANRHLGGAGLTERQFAILEALYHLGPMRQNELAQKMLCTSGNLTGVLEKLEKLQLTKRIMESVDRRCQSVSLTKRGESLIKKLFPLHLRSIVAATSGITQSEQIALKNLLKKLGLSAALSSK